MNKVLKQMGYKGQTAALSVIFVLVGMVFLVPPITEKALAGVKAVAKGICGPHPCEFTLVGSHLDNGFWVSRPTQSGTLVKWVTTGLLGNEKGSVTYKVGAGETAVLSFENPTFGKNKCGVSGISGKCYTGRGQEAEFTYHLYGK